MATAKQSGHGTEHRQNEAMQEAAERTWPGLSEGSPRPEIEAPASPFHALIAQWRASASGTGYWQMREIYLKCATELEALEIAGRSGELTPRDSDVAGLTTASGNINTEIEAACSAERLMLLFAIENDPNHWATASLRGQIEELKVERDQWQELVINPKGLEERTATMLAAIRQGYDLSAYAAAVKWDGSENQVNWLEGLRQRIEAFQALSESLGVRQITK